MKIRLLIFSFIRSEYGLLAPLLNQINEDDEIEACFAVGGAHLLPQFGLTIEEIRKDGFKIYKELPFLKLGPDNDVDMFRSLSNLQNLLADLFDGEKFDGVLVAGDRYELLAVANSCLLKGIPLIHLSGGEITEGAIDNQVRHAISKIANLHYPSNSLHAQNLMNMGEEAWRVCVAGETALDLIKTIDLMSKDELCDNLNIDRNKHLACVTFHPDTITREITPNFITDLFIEFSKMSEFQFVVSGANSDHEGLKINSILQNFSEKNKNIRFVLSLGQKRYYSLLKNAKFMIGNSSSALIEAQSFSIPAINVGKRQLGRLQNPNVHSVSTKIEKILSSIPFVLSEEFKIGFKDKPNLYGDGHACERIVNHLKSNLKNKDIMMKKTVFSRSGE